MRAAARTLICPEPHGGRELRHRQGEGCIDRAVLAAVDRDRRNAVGDRDHDDGLRQGDRPRARCRRAVGGVGDAARGCDRVAERGVRQGRSQRMAADDRARLQHAADQRRGAQDVGIAQGKGARAGVVAGGKRQARRDEVARQMHRAVGIGADAVLPLGAAVEHGAARQRQREIRRRHREIEGAVGTVAARAHDRHRQRAVELRDAGRASAGSKAHLVDVAGIKLAVDFALRRAAGDRNGRRVAARA